MVYPSGISDILAGSRHAKPVPGNAAGSDANFACGSFVRFQMQIDRSQMVISSVNFASNGCGYMLATAEALAREVSGKKLADLHGLDHEELSKLAISTIGGVALERESCVAAAIAALRNAFADFRSRQIEEFRGEKALICTCFGVTEELIESAIRSSGLRTVDEVSSTTKAGSGCGSCRMLIQEMLDGAA